MDKIKVAFFCLFLGALSHNSFADSYLAPQELVVSTNAFVIIKNTMGVNVASPVSVMQINAYPGNTTLMSLESSARLGILRAYPTQEIDVAGDIKLTNNGGVIYRSATLSTPQDNKDWRLIWRDDCNDYTDGSTTGWFKSDATAFTKVTTFNTFKILGGYDSAASSIGYLYKDYTLPTHTYAKVIVEFYAIDSWGYQAYLGEWAYMKCTDPNSSTRTMFEWIEDSNCIAPVSYSDLGTAVSLPGTNYGGVSGYRDVVLSGLAQGYHTGSTLRVHVGSTIDQAYTDESWGIGSIEVWVR